MVGWRRLIRRKRWHPRIPTYRSGNCDGVPIERDGFELIVALISKRCLFFWRLKAWHFRSTRKESLVLAIRVLFELPCEHRQ